MTYTLSLICIDGFRRLCEHNKDLLTEAVWICEVLLMPYIHTITHNQSKNVPVVRQGDVWTSVPLFTDPYCVKRTNHHVHLLDMPIRSDTCFTLGARIFYRRSRLTLNIVLKTFYRPPFTYHLSKINTIDIHINRLLHVWGSNTGLSNPRASGSEDGLRLTSSTT